MRIRYNAPVILTFAFVSIIVTALTKYYLPDLINNWFSVPGKGNFNPANLRHWLNLLTHVIGHYDWSLLMANFAFILLIGPLLEKNYGSPVMLLILIITALVAGILNILLFPIPLMGASCIVFMMILLASFTNFNRGEIPLTFILILILYLGEQIISSYNTGSISYLAPIAGGFCGSLFGFFFRTKRKK